MIRAFLTVAAGVIALLAAYWLNTNQASFVADVSAAIKTASAVLGFFGVTIGLGTIGAAAADTEGGFRALSVHKVAAPGILTVAGGLLLAAAR